MRALILVRYGEIGLKGMNRRYFEKKFIKNIIMAVKHIEDAYVIDRHGRAYVDYNTKDHDEVIDIVTKIFGVVSISIAYKIDNDFELMKTEGLAEVKRQMLLTGATTFKVETKRANKGFPIKSPDICQKVGGYILSNVEGLKVDVNNPQITLTLEIREKTYIYCERIPGPGGMPYGTAGKGMLLLSGGIDSPVAAYLIGKRGVELEAVHFHSYPFTSDRALEKVIDLGKKLTQYTRNLKIHSVNILEIQKAINENCPSEEMTLLSRRFMMKIAEQLAVEQKCGCLITGENIGQVASQTMEGLTVTNNAVNMVVLRPLIAYDKVDIIKIAKQIDTFEISILPFEDCCTVFLPDRVVTRPKVDKIINSENLVNGEELIAQAIEQKKTYIISKGELLE
ncbi:tRNA uracil 4-sulfurtransferase ThiI [Fusibacter sp. 3D3]|uniref:tRNA uracil 4-sulfurtransferase ThiI n=1 Tax=Fusibacter sp. 3D3 TaxID=1048380 RepID=UPI0008534974|nr:tRNA uracil 4-sulfurtransferase ThiI [Fusibacter sp. 3D3]GAU79194.1 tRNA S(4)U 4-thiouridine synthase [Fusibacter sp. 3D3]